MWRYTRMVVLTSLTAAIYAAILIPFKGIPIIPGITEIRPANAIPVVFGLMFGPAGAWGSAMGNLIGDFFGTLTPGSIFGFIGNFFYGFVGYKVWGRLWPISSGRGPDERSCRQLFEYIMVALLSSSICALIIGWGVEILGLFPFGIIGGIILLNNSLASILLGPPLIWLLYPRVARWDLLWTEVMDKRDISGQINSGIGSLLLAVSGLGGMITGMLISWGVLQGIGIVPALAPFLILLIIGSLLV